MAPRDKHGRRFAAAIVVAAIAPSLAGCFSDREAAANAYPADVRERHPVVLAQAPRVLDVFVQGHRGLDARESRDVEAFVEEYRAYGSGPLLAQVPVGVPDTGAAMRGIRQAGAGRVAVSRYTPADPAVASPVRLSFRRMQAQVASQCGLWPQDLGVVDYSFTSANRPYWNHGCAVQSNFAAQIADPVDLVRGRQMTPPDTGRRMGNIDKLRQAQDPTTTYKTESISVKSAVGQ